MVRDEEPGSRVVRLKRGQVMCQAGTCNDEAEFLVRQGKDRLRAVCEKHLRALGITEPEIPPKKFKK